MARYHSAMCRERNRGLTFYFGLTEVPKRPQLDPLDPVNWDWVMQIKAQAHRCLAYMAEASGVTVRWFGQQAPTLRKPPEIVFD